VQAFLSFSLGKAGAPGWLWTTAKTSEENVARLIYLEEIGPKSGGHDIPYQRKRIMTISKDYGADKLIIDATGMGGAIEQDLRVACVESQIQFVPFVFTGGPKGTKTQIYRDYVSYIQQKLVKIPHPDDLEPNQAKLVEKWLREHIDLEYTMDAANKTEKIAAPSGKHDDYCDSSAIALHACLQMLPASGTFASVSVKQTGTSRRTVERRPVFRTSRRSHSLNKGGLRGI